MDSCTAFVTGAGGFIGHSVTRALLKGGFKVRALLGAPGQRVRQLPSDVPVAIGDITEGSVLRTLARGADVAIHVAGPPSVRASFEDPAEYVRTHVVGTAAMLDACHSVGLRRFVYISSAEVYGSPEGPVVNESAGLSPRSPYAAAKVGAEQLTASFSRSLGMTVVVLRPFSIYGPGASPFCLLRTILRMALREDEIVLSDPRPVRDYCYVDDLADAVTRCCTADLPGLTTLNIGTGRGTSVGELAGLVLETLGRSVPVRAGGDAARPGDSEVYRLVADVTLAYDALGWRASTVLEEGLRQMVAAMNCSARTAVYR